MIEIIGYEFYKEVVMTNAIEEFRLEYRGRKTVHNGKVFFPVVDVLEALIGTKRPGKYWRDMQARENTQLSAICGKLRFTSPNGKSYLLDSVDIEGLFRLVQSIPSPNVENFKQYMAHVARERVEEDTNPELAIKRGTARAVGFYKRRGMDDKWIRDRIDTINNRNMLTDILKEAGVTSPKEYAAVTARTHVSAFGIPPKSHKQLKGLHPEKGKLRDNMVSQELGMTSMSETLMSELLKNGLTVEEATRKHTALVSSMRENIEKSLGRSIATSDTPSSLKDVVKRVVRRTAQLAFDLTSDE